MSSFDPKRRLFVLACAALAGCGYQPAFGPSGPAEVLRASVALEPPSNPDEFALAGHLERLLAPADQPDFRLSYDIAVFQDGVGVTPAQEIFRYNLIGKVTYALRRIDTGDVVATGSVDGFTSYSAASVNTTTNPPRTNATVSSDAALRDARERLMVLLADLMFSRLVATAADWNG